MTGELQVTRLPIDAKQVPAAEGRAFTVVTPSNGTAVAAHRRR